MQWPVMEHFQEDGKVWRLFTSSSFPRFPLHSAGLVALSELWVFLLLALLYWMTATPGISKAKWAPQYNIWSPPVILPVLAHWQTLITNFPEIWAVHWILELPEDVVFSIAIFIFSTSCKTMTTLPWPDLIVVSMERHLVPWNWCRYRAHENYVSYTSLTCCCTTCKAARVLRASQFILPSTRAQTISTCRTEKLMPSRLFN